MPVVFSGRYSREQCRAAIWLDDPALDRWSGGGCCAVRGERGQSLRHRRLRLQSLHLKHLRIPIDHPAPPLSRRLRSEARPSPGPTISPSTRRQPVRGEHPDEPTAARRAGRRHRGVARCRGRVGEPDRGGDSIRDVRRWGCMSPTGRSSVPPRPAPGESPPLDLTARRSQAANDPTPAEDVCANTPRTRLGAPTRMGAARRQRGGLRAYRHPHSGAAGTALGLLPALRMGYPRVHREPCPPPEPEEGRTARPPGGARETAVNEPQAGGSTLRVRGCP
jgi:hypothetical protein